MTKIKFDLTDMKKENLIKGFDSLSEKLFLEESGNLVVLASWVGGGKTAFALNLALNIAQFFLTQKKEKAVEFISLEGSSNYISEKIFSIFSEIDFSLLKTGKLNKEEYNKVLEIENILSNFPFYIDDTFNFSISNIESRIREQKTKKNIGIVFIDYLQLINSNYVGNDFEKTSHIIKSLKALSKELNIPIILLSQISSKINDRENKIATLLDFGEASSLIKHADIILFLHREEFFLSQREPEPGTDKHNCWLKKLNEIYNEADLIIAKNRHGKTEKIKLYFDKSTLKFKDLQRE
jgi:replicative DNA helicase